ncbi:hypothetical protein BSKO_10196 [Bryopsis sp. KO-2023]|nr:hypothetical protein BSKO_10196 [Bryopsis sp. KO-2023]
MSNRPSSRSGVTSRGLKNKPSREEVIDDIDRLENTIRSIGYQLPDVSAETSEFQRVADTVDEILTKNRELMEMRCRGKARSSEEGMGGLLKTQGLVELARKLRSASAVLETAQERLPDMALHKQEGPSIPVEVEHQADFVKLVRVAAQDRDNISDCASAMVWLSKTKETPDMWREHIEKQSEAGKHLESAWKAHTDLTEMIKEHQKYVPFLDAMNPDDDIENQFPHDDMGMDVD